MMHHQKAKLEGAQLLERIKERNFRNKERVNDVKMIVLQLANDLYPKSEARAQRKEEGLCVCCFYLERHRIAGCAMTDSNCMYCEKVTHFSSTATDDFCLECATKLKICKRCGADIDLKDRRKL